MSDKYEYAVHFWGGFFQTEEAISKGYKEGSYYFDTKEER